MTFDEIQSKPQQTPQKTSGLTWDDISGAKDPVQQSINDVHKDLESHATNPVTSFFSGLKAKAGQLAGGYAAGGVPGALAYAFPEQFMNTARHAPEVAASLVKGTAKTAIQFPQTAIGSAAQLPGDIMSYVGQKPVENTPLHQFGEKMMTPTDVPLLGQVKALSAAPGDVERSQAQTPGETLKQAGNIYLEGGMPGASKLLGAGIEAAGFGKGTFSKWANRISTIPEEAVNAAQNPKTAQEIKALREGTLPAGNIPELPNIPKPVKPTMMSTPEAGPVPGTPEEIKSVGQNAYETAKAQNAAAGEAYSKTRQALIDANEGKIISRSKEFVTGTKDALSTEGITVKNGKVSLVGSQFEGSPAAQGHIQRVYDLMARPAVKGKSVAADLLTRREALSTVMNDIPPEQANLRRVVGNMRTAFDGTLDRIIGEEASSARTAYSTTKSATQPVIKAMTKVENGKRVFSEDKAYSFVNTALKDSKFDNSNLLAELDKVAGTAHASDVQKIADARTAYEQAMAEAETRVAQANAASKTKYAEDSAKYGETMARAKAEQTAAKEADQARITALKTLNKTLSSTTPELQAGMMSVLREYATKIPVLKDTASVVLTPKFWGDIAISRGLKAGEKTVGMSPEAKKAAMWLLTNMIAAPTK